MSQNKVCYRLVVKDEWVPFFEDLMGEYNTRASVQIAADDYLNRAKKYIQGKREDGENWANAVCSARVDIVRIKLDPAGAVINQIVELKAFHVFY